MSGIIAVYGLVVSVLISGGSESCSTRRLLVRRLTGIDAYSEGERLFTVRGIHPPWRGYGVWIHWSGCGIRYWLRRRLGERDASRPAFPVSRLSF